MDIVLTMISAFITEVGPDLNDSIFWECSHRKYFYSLCLLTSTPLALSFFDLFCFLGVKSKPIFFRFFECFLILFDPFISNKCTIIAEATISTMIVEDWPIVS